MRPSAGLCLCVAAGGAIGAVLRWTAGEVVPDGSGFPWTTFAINVSGALLLALAQGIPAVRRSPAWGATVGPGLLGGYTTLSAYSEQARTLLSEGRTPLAAAYVVGTLLACLAAVALADALSARLAPSEDPAR